MKKLLACMINMRNTVRKMDYNPVIGFDSVERVAARDIGAKTVQYVAYRLTEERESKRDGARKRAGIH